jgi:hypothetical protein
MRRTVRPFIKEFKSRSSKAPTGRVMAPPIEESRPEPPIFDIPDILVRNGAKDDAYEAALRAADAVFNRRIETPPLSEPVTAAAVSPPQPAGRILPSLIEHSAAEAAPREPIRLRKARASRTAEQSEPAARARRGRPPSEPKRERPRPPAAEPPVAEFAPSEPDRPESDAPRRSHRPIQSRWVLKTELRAGEKWKRRLPEAAR